MNILITAGGTTESIDTVRGITNFSSGRLGAKIADEFLRLDNLNTLYYLSARQSVKPAIQSDKVTIIDYTDVASLEKIACELLQDEDIDVIIHSAAVSDYKIAKVLGPDGKILDRNEKINSSMLKLTVELERTPKIISELKTLSPKSSLVGFKLLSNATVEQLLTAANETLTENSCSFVLANRLEDIAGEEHKAYLLSSAGLVAEYDTKTEIAKGLADHLGLVANRMVGL
ncbi:phosphopantothenate--cysteine ligase [Candidatus Saccharibacteria bacterium]|nr:phosphopantothenate--cysteine ligase [Candidatus Saccharibacteria bacterium]